MADRAGRTGPRDGAVDRYSSRPNLPKIPVVDVRDHKGVGPPWWIGEWQRTGSFLADGLAGSTPPEVYATGRVCVAEDCTVKLSRYNSTEWCALHESPASTQRPYDTSTRQRRRTRRTTPRKEKANGQSQPPASRPGRLSGLVVPHRRPPAPSRPSLDAGPVRVRDPIGTLRPSPSRTGKSWRVASRERWPWSPEHPAGSGRPPPWPWPPKGPPWPSPPGAGTASSRWSSGSATTADVLVIETDITDEAAARAMVEATVTEFGRLDTVVNNAGVMLLGPIVDAPVEEWRRMVELNLLGLLYTTHAALPHLLAGGRAGAPPGGRPGQRQLGGRPGRPAGKRRLQRHQVRGGGLLRVPPPGGDPPPRPGDPHRARRGARPSWPATTGPRSWRPSAPHFGQTEIMQAEDIAESIVFTVTRPRHVAVNEVLIRPTEQER